jgi:hypothetical protein
MAICKIERVRHLAREGQCHECKGKNEALGEKGDHASIVIRGSSAAGMAAAVVCGIGGDGIIAVQPSVEFRARGEDCESQHQDDSQEGDDPLEERSADAFLAGHGVQGYRFARFVNPLGLLHHGTS